MSKGFIFIHRELINWEWYTSPNHIRVFIHLLLRANHASATWKGISVDAGQIITGRKKLSAELELSENKIRKVLSDLQSTGEITIKSFNKYSIISITNWDGYQSNHQQTTSKNTNKTPTNHQQITTNNKKNKKNKNNNQLSVLNLPEEQAEWISSISDASAKKLLTYDNQCLIEEIEKAYIWNSEQKQKKKNIGSFLTNWMKRVNSKEKAKAHCDSALLAVFEGGE